MRQSSFVLAATAAAGLLALSAGFDAASARDKGGGGGGGGGHGMSGGGSGGGARSAAPSGGGRSFGQSSPSGRSFSGRSSSGERGFTSSRQFSGRTHIDGGRRHADRGHRHGHRHGRRAVIIGGAPYYDDSYSYSYSGCDYYHRRALATGSRYWWRRYYECTGEDY